MKPTIERDGQTYCLTSQSGDVGTYTPCHLQQLASTNPNIGFGLVVVTFLVAGLSWGSSVVTTRQSQYSHLLSAISRARTD